MAGGDGHLPYCINIHILALTTKPPLLAQGRVRGARKDSATGEWDLSGVAIPRVRPGRRGPGLRLKSSRAG